MGFLNFVQFSELDIKEKRKWIQMTKNIILKSGYNIDFVINKIGFGNASEPYNLIRLKNGIDLYDGTFIDIDKANAKEIKQYINKKQ